MARNKPQVVPPSAPFLPPPGTDDEGVPTLDLRAALESRGTLRLVQRQAAQLRDVLALPEDHEGRDKQSIRYQDALNRNGIETPPETIHEAIELINEVGEFHG